MIHDTTVPDHSRMGSTVLHTKSSPPPPSSSSSSSSERAAPRRKKRVPVSLLVLGQLLITLVIAHRFFFQPRNLFSTSLSSFILSEDPGGFDDATTLESKTIETTTIGVSITVTKCSSSNENIVDGAMVLQYSILQQPSKYRFKFYIHHHPDAVQCVQSLAPLGWTLLEREVPINISLIEGDFLRERIAGSGCCGERELIKFEAFLLTDHPVIILFDMDMLVLKPLDELIDMILYKNPNPLNASSSSSSSRIMRRRHLQWPENYSVVDDNDVWLLHVNDYTMSTGDRAQKYHPMQGGFAVIQPNVSIYQEMCAIVLKGNYNEKGWGGVAGFYWGSTTFQGLMPYYFNILYPGHSLELKWCIHDAMNTPSPFEIREGNETVCTVPTCEDCSKVHFSEIYSFHYTECPKPWMCSPMSRDDPSLANCRHMHHAWFDSRSRMEASWGRSGQGSGFSTKPQMRAKFHGYCTKYHSDGYEAIRPPYGTNGSGLLLPVVD